MIKKVLLLIMTVCLCQEAICQRSFRLPDDENCLTPPERQSLERQINHQLNFYNRVFPDSVYHGADLQITILDSRLNYVSYLSQKNINVSAQSSGVYSETLKEIVVWRNKDKSEQLIRTCSHEVSHFLLRRRIKSPPTWLNEGLATYLERTRISSKGSIKHEPDNFYKSRVKTMIFINDINIPDFLTWNGSKFSNVSFTQDSYGYAIAYCIIDFLNKKDESILIDIIHSLLSNLDSTKAFDKCYPGGLDAFNRDFMAASK